ncbi:cytochrome b/b6 domain-containing protein [Microbacterium sp. A94]|uniref:cytochrome b/b6 domain-containing protein n=1 Tax=Microbacterium sp. A94 TaxID=3450717 RepID=UPI003F41B727
MATRMLRRGLPRVIGGEPWPPASDVEVADAVAEAVAPASVQEVSAAESQVSVAEPVEVSDTSGPNPSTGSGNSSSGSAVVRNLRRGLPRTPGGEPWPRADAAPAASPASDVAAPVVAAAPVAAAAAPTATDAPVAAAAPAAATSAAGGTALRRGLPRTPGGESWPPAGTSVAARVSDPSTGSGSEAGPGTEAGSAVEATESTVAAASGEPAAAGALVSLDVSDPLPFPQTVFPGKYAFTHLAPEPEPERIGPFTKAQWAGTVIIGGLGLLGAAAMAVVFVRWFLTLTFMQDFLTTYPGEYHLPEGAPVGFPGWLGWQHFFNVFLMVLIIRSGLSVRHDKRPTAFWTARGNAKTKISLTLWFHQALDILWLVNGIVFVILLFVTGQWMRVIPTSWEVFPNALSAALQYVSLDWPTENGWVNYNSLQQLAYGTTIFIAAPLAAITGVRMSGLWPKNATKLNKAYPVEWARALHFPVMLYFVVFIFIHVALVLTTGALRNLNHMYAAQGSVDGAAYADNWTGFWMLVASLVVIAAAWVAARPMVLAPIAKLFGNVSAR